MTKQLYEEALADVKRVKEVAEANAQRAILDVVTPRIRDLIEKEMLREGLDDDDDIDDGFGFDDLGSAAGINTGLDVGASNSIANAISVPDEEGKVTLDLDALSVDPAGMPLASNFSTPMLLADDEYEINLESISALTPVLNATRSGAAKEFELMVFRLAEDVARFSSAGKLIRESNKFRSQITQMISKTRDMYDYVQGSISDPAKKSSYETKLENCFKELNQLQEPMMSHKSRQRIHEEDVTLKLTGLPDEIDLDSVGVDLITGEDDAGEDQGGDDASLDMGDDDGGDEGADDGGEDDGLGDLDLDDSGNDDEEKMGEARGLSDDTVVEIDEGMLRREISRMKRLREENEKSGSPHTSATLAGFGGGKEDGHPFDGQPLGEADEDLDELDMMDELDGMDEVNPVADKSPEACAESLNRRAQFEARLQNRTRARGESLKEGIAKARRQGNLRVVQALKSEYSKLVKRFNESVNRTNNIKKSLVENNRRRNGSAKIAGSTRLAESQAVASLRNKLSETNLINAKLMLTNKLLQNESLSPKQKASVIRKLDSAQTVREAKLVYESLSEALGDSRRSVNEGNERSTRTVIGSSSRPTRSAASSSLNEGHEADRWAKLAGITKK